MSNIEPSLHELTIVMCMNYLVSKFGSSEWVAVQEVQDLKGLSVEILIGN